MKRAALYVRVSTQEQKNHGLSVDSQIVALREYCLENDYSIAGIYNDAGISARKRYTRRPALLQLLKDCEEKKIDIVLFTKLDRWFRSVGDYYEVQAILDRHHVPWRAIWEDYETETSSGVFRVNIMLSVAQAEADRTSERIKSVFEYKRSQGHHIGNTPTGYIRKDGFLYKDPEKEDMVKLIFDTYLKSHSSWQVQKALIDNGYTLSQSAVKHILTLTAYYGDAHGSKCEPYITKEQWDLIQASKSKYTRHTKDKRVYMFTGLVKCGYCGRRLHAGTCRANNGMHYSSYRCFGIEAIGKHKGFSWSEKKLESYMVDNLDALLYQYRIDIKAKAKDNDYDKAIKKKESLEKKLDRIGIRFEMGDISIDEYKEKRRETMLEIESLQIKPPKEPQQLPHEWRTMYNALDNSHKRDFWYSVIDSIILCRNGDKPPKISFI